MDSIAATNKEAAEAWSGPLFDRFVQFRGLVIDGLGAHGEAALAAHPPRPGGRALDIGCGFGDTTRRLAEIVGAGGEAVGVDVSEPFIEAARRRRMRPAPRTCASPAPTSRWPSWRVVSTTPSRAWA